MRLVQVTGERLDGVLAAPVLRVPDRRPQFVPERRVSAGEQLFVGVPAGVLAEEPGIAPVAFRVIEPHVYTRTQLRTMRRGDPDHDICHSWHLFERSQAWKPW
jgi:hypothetical protein